MRPDHRPPHCKARSSNYGHHLQQEAAFLNPQAPPPPQLPEALGCAAHITKGLLLKAEKVMPFICKQCEIQQPGRKARRMQGAYPQANWPHLEADSTIFTRWHGLSRRDFKIQTKDQ